MSKKIFSFFLILPLLGVGCAQKTVTPAVAPVVEQPVAEAPAPVPSNGEMVVIEYKDGTFTPKEVRITPGTTVAFKNVGTRGVWPASDIHPTHLLCPGFDPRRILRAGESWSYTFREKQTCPFHNHISATEIGIVVVE